MTQKVNPSPVRPAEAFKTAGSIALSGGVENGYVATAATDLSTQDTGIDETVLNSFAETHSATSYDVTIDPGEAFIYGSWTVIDVATTVTLDASTAAQTVYVGWDKDAANGVIIGKEATFSTAADNTDKKIPLYDFDTDGSGVASVTDRRDLGKTQTTENIDIATKLGIPVYSDPSNASQDEGSLIFVDGSGSVVEGVYSFDGTQYERVGETPESIQDIVSTLVIGGTNISVSYDDAGDSLTIDSSALNAEEVEDQVNTLLSAGSNVNLTYDDANDTLSIASEQRTQEDIEDFVDGLISSGTNIATSYDDLNGVLTIDTSALNSEEVQDEVNGLLSSSSNIDLTYDDAANDLNIDLSNTLESIDIDSTDTYLQEWYNSGEKRADIDNNGNMRIKGEITEGATL